MLAVGDDDAQDAAPGTAVLLTDTGGTTDDFYTTPESSAITIGGSPQEMDYIQIRVRRVPADVGDTCAVDAIFKGLEVYITTNAATDA
jgi:hypothetical protein